MDDLDDGVLSEALSTIPKFFELRGRKYGFRQPMRIFVKRRGVVEVNGCLEYIDAPVDVVVDTKNRTAEDMLSHENVSLEKHVSPYGYFDPAENSITLCLDPIWNLANRAVDFFESLDFKQAYVAYLRGVFLHELTHSTFDHSNELRMHRRLSEGLANLIPILVGSKLEVALQGFKVMRQDLRYNYHFWMARYVRVSELVSAIYDGKYDLGTHLFLNEILGPATQVNCEKGPKIHVKGDVRQMFFGFGGNGVELFVGGALDPICNFSGRVVAGRIELIEGYLDPEETIAVANEVADMPYYGILMPKTNNIFVVPRNVVDIREEIERGNYDLDDILGRHLEFRRRTSVLNERHKC